MTQTLRGLPRWVTAGGRPFLVEIARHPAARRYVLRVTSDGRLRLTVPRFASIGGGMAFAARQHDWIVREWRRLEHRASEWSSGTEIWYRGTRVALAVTDHTVRFGDQIVRLDDRGGSVRAAVEQHVRNVAAAELPVRTKALADARGIVVTRVQVRNQRSRWGSCSTRGAIALNWRLLQMPPEVADYVMLHELAHRKHPNHSARFWREVDALCPWWRAAEKWIRRYGKELL
jgi:predicted metal-dependent hydrolase